MVVGPARALLGHRRLIVVSEGALEYVPFAALADPAAPRSYAPLLAAHEIVRLPSMSAIEILRRSIQQRRPAAKALAVLADPVFDASDPRVTQSGAQPEPATDGAPLRRALDDTGGDIGRLARLIGSRREAASILSLVPPQARYAAFDFDASRDAVTGGGLAGYRIVHLATHSVLNTRHPELTGIVLSLVNRQGAPQDGFLRLHELFNLKLPAELVVLSACQTALGPNVRGEGIVGLARGFMYAGAARIVAAQWKVDDAATAELMKRFYGAMLGPSRQRPAAALRAAQLSMWRDPAWSSPYYWAAFGVLGEWR
jgi:CHAT domain-containing protein